MYFLTWHKKKELLFLHFIFLLTIFLSSSAFSSSKQFLFPSRKCYHMLLNIHFFFAKSLRFACKKNYSIQFSYVLSLKFMRHWRIVKCLLNIGNNEFPWKSEYKITCVCWHGNDKHFSEVLCANQFNQFWRLNGLFVYHHDLFIDVLIFSFAAKLLLSRIAALCDSHFRHF